uniref:Glycosyltransferase 2-like domain-containing protein n=1 Tax=Lates calcarifer TaxID=8187 RepID=A0A4W6BJU4_LATCA
MSTLSLFNISLSSDILLLQYPDSLLHKYITAELHCYKDNILSLHCCIVNCKPLIYYEKNQCKFLKFMCSNPTSSSSRHPHPHHLPHRTTSVLSKLLFAAPNSPLQYPIQGFTVQPLTTTHIPGMSVSGIKHSKHQSHFTSLIMESSSLLTLNDLLAKVSYTTRKQNFYLKNLNSLKVLLNSIRQFYSNIEVIIADDSFEPEHITGEHIRHYIMPPAQGWFAGRNLAVSQVTTKYFLWVDDDFVFTENTKIEKMVEVMEAVPELDVVGGSVQGNQFYFSILYEQGEEMEGGCLYRKSKGKFHSLPGYPECYLASGVVNFFLARTDAVQRVGFDPKLQRVAHSEFFMDGLGSLMVATCGQVSIGHQPKTGKNPDAARYAKFRASSRSDNTFKLLLHFFKNHLKCIRYG